MYLNKTIKKNYKCPNQMEKNYKKKEADVRKWLKKKIKKKPYKLNL